MTTTNESNDVELPDDKQARVHRIVHTPGPWTVTPKYFDEHGEALRQIEAEPRMLAEVYACEGEEGDANALMMAAAPEMYRLIRKCYKVLHMGVWEVDETDQEVSDQINDVMWNHFGDAWRPKADEVV